jgi:hypothetical protein
MKGVVVVGSMPDSGGGGSGGGGGGGGSSAPAVPDSAKSLVVAMTAALVSILALSYFFIRYGGDYGEEFESA